MAKAESTEDYDDSIRMWASAAFVAVLIVLGLPLWWKTTEVYRVSLPYDKIAGLDELSFKVGANLTILANDVPTTKELEGLIQDLFKGQDLINLKIHTKLLDADLRRELSVLASDEEALELMMERTPADVPGHVFLVQRPVLYQDVWVADERVVFFRNANAAPTLLKVLQYWIYQLPWLEGARAARGGDAARRMRMPPAANYDVTLSLVHPRPDSLTVEFDVAEAAEDYIGSFVDELSELHNVTVKSQWLHLLELDFHAKQVQDDSPWGRHYAVSEERLPLLLTPLESRTGTHVSRHATINLLLYANPCDTAPLRIYDKYNRMVGASVEAFMSPRWGGVVLGSPSHAACARELAGEARSSVYTPPARLVMGTFLAQLRELLGFHKVPPLDGALLKPLRSVVPRAWEKDAVLRMRALEQLTSAKLTLQSLAQLLGQISNIVINDEVGASIHSSVSNIELADKLLAEGRLLEGYRASLAAFLSAEAAFADPSLLALLYFPDDQKYAVYIPLFLPVMIPVLFSLKNLLDWLRGKAPNKDKLE